MKLRIKYLFFSLAFLILANVYSAQRIESIGSFADTMRLKSQFLSQFLPGVLLHGQVEYKFFVDSISPNNKSNNMISAHINELAFFSALKNSKYQNVVYSIGFMEDKNWIEFRHKKNMGFENVDSVISKLKESFINASGVKLRKRKIIWLYGIEYTESNNPVKLGTVVVSLIPDVKWDLFQQTWPIYGETEALHTFMSAVRENYFHELKLNSEKQKNQYRFYGALLMASFLVVFLYVVYYNLKKIEKKNVAISEQKQLIEEANIEIKDSISYAKRIQSAILPPSRIVKEYLKESFVLYKPKDIVAGDFYWMESVGNKVLFAAADCTGHGVPGAMVSVICNNGLNRAVREYGLTDPGEILNKTRDIVIQEFEKSDEEVKDGMDIALCSLEGNKLQFAGAHNPLWIIRNGEVLETKADKQPIGKFDHATPYATHTIDLQAGDILYIFSDGYVDQFGGDKGKKFRAKQLRELLVSIQDKSMEEQKSLIDAAFEEWKGNEPQVDDVCMIGVRV